MPNRLGDQTSPYLLQHADNPVDWYPWGDDAFEAARQSNRPVLLSVGYSACHWCHVMAHESFEDPDTAAIMNKLFVNIKVDREERPDVDAIYMNAVQALTGRGGWPMTVWMTPDAKPFYAGTYFPNDDRHGMASFKRVMAAVSDAWDNRQGQVAEQADQLAATIDRHIPAAEDFPTIEDIRHAYEALANEFDPVNGGLGGAPKFPQEPTIELLLRVANEPWATDAKQMAFTTLSKMAAGGIYDHVGGGFARYAVDATWTIPHFEKMLYNNAQLARLYVRAWQLGGPDSFRSVAIDTIDYVLRDLTHPEGGFFSAEDADSEGEEGKFYVFTADEFADIVGDDAGIAGQYFGVSARGNFEGSNHLTAAMPAKLVAERFSITEPEVLNAVERARTVLGAERLTRVRPGLDDKVVVAWNGLMLRTLAEAGAILDDERYLEAARANARFVLNNLIVDGQLMRSWGKGKTSVPGYLDDYAGYALGLFSLYMATGEVEWYQPAADLTDQIGDRFGDGGGSLFQTDRQAEQLITRPKDQMDNPLPSGTSMAVEALTWLSLYTGEPGYDAQARQAVKDAGKLLESYPSAVGYLAAVTHSILTGYKEVAIVGPGADELAKEVWSAFRPNLILAVDRAGSDGRTVPLLADRKHPGTAAFVCERFVCQLPVTFPSSLRDQL
ncbi:MAG: thioredoxin domain-containing protein [Acidimicrobiia bacterium]|nr:thioredoxin domain-containing protein [Acidimicrobiia bacterium]